VIGTINSSAGAGMDLSPPSKRIKGFSPLSQSTAGFSSVGHSSQNKKNSHSHANHHHHLQDFDPSHLLTGHNNPAAVLIGKLCRIFLFEPCCIELGLKRVIYERVKKE
jgi:hypothetical protein